MEEASNNNERKCNIKIHEQNIMYYPIVMDTSFKTLAIVTCKGQICDIYTQKNNSLILQYMRMSFHFSCLESEKTIMTYATNCYLFVCEYYATIQLFIKV